MTFDSETISIDDDFEDVNDYLYRREMTDGLPVVPPTAERVERMLEGTSREPDEELGTIPPKYGVATVEKIAINAVMAGCEPAYMPVLIAAVEAMTEEEFNLYGVNATTHPVAPMLVVNGPIVEEINLNYGYNVFGQGYRANATIGRTVRLLLVNLGGGTPGDMDRATHGHPGKYSFCIAENEKKNPWDPLHVQRGFDEDESAVTVMGVEAPHEINDHVNEKPAELLTIAADVFATVGNNNSHHTHGEICIVLGPEHADTIARNDWSREDVQWFLYDNARNELETLRTAGITDNYTWHHRFEVENDDARIPLVETPEDVTVVVAGGAGKHSMALHSFGETRSVTVDIDEEV
ncbi:hypothetical protein HYG81_24190 (plasmid) [Natrinema zhouii]|uniref:hypothetical protein n=1 Tax=Natrinema zhouii TaxID=1710539 RepID=UPI001CFF9590|nr:hypothetical protein [Natrinema zhouii]UHQ98872.1 hypothetical protein HYG81_24190 [Natrinema zhouii]